MNSALLSIVPAVTAAHQSAATESKPDVKTLKQLESVSISCGGHLQLDWFRKLSTRHTSDDSCLKVSFKICLLFHVLLRNTLTPEVNAKVLRKAQYMF